MKQILTAVSLLALLAACDDGQPFTFDEVVEPEPTDPDAPPPAVGIVPAVIAGNLADVTYDPGSNTIRVQIASLDTTPDNATYARNEALDVPGYVAYSVQEDPLDRMFIAMASRSNDGATEASVVADGGQFGRFFGGVYFTRLGAYSEPDTSRPGGLVSYAGDYVGLSNLDAPRPGQILPVPVGTDPAIIPQQPMTVTGQVFINADFADNSVNGAIFDRVDDATGFEFVDLDLIVTDITTDGTFEGTVERGPNVFGSYAGVFGGTGATSVSGGIRIENYLEDVDNEEEYGIFVLTQCGAAGDAPICSDVRP